MQHSETYEAELRVKAGPGKLYSGGNFKMGYDLWLKNNTGFCEVQKLA